LFFVAEFHGENILSVRYGLCYRWINSGFAGNRMQASFPRLLLLQAQRYLRDLPRGRRFEPIHILQPDNRRIVS
jgi:hypothetical protein